MPVRMRLRREGKKKQPFYRIVVTPARKPRDGGFIEDLGYYQPLWEPSSIKIDHDRALYWLHQGVQPTEQVKQILRLEGVWEQFKPGDPGRDRSAKPASQGAQAAAEQERGGAAEQAPQADQGEAGEADEVVGGEDAADAATAGAGDTSAEDTVGNEDRS